MPLMQALHIRNPRQQGLRWRGMDSKLFFYSVSHYRLLPSGESCDPPQTPPLGEFLEATADARVRARGAVAVHVEQTVVQVLVIVATAVQTRVGSAEVPVIRDGAEREPTDCCTGGPKTLSKTSRPASHINLCPREKC